MKLLLYCTKAKPNIVKGLNNEFYISNAFKEEGIDDYKINGKIIAECDFEVEDLRIVDDDPLGAYWYETKTLSENEVLEKSCLTGDELFDYLGEDNEGYAIHIKNLHIFDEPMELSNFLYEDDTDGHYGVWEVERTPVNYTIIATEVKDIGGVYCCRGTYGRFLALSSQELCDILNGKKTIIVRKRISKEMIR